MNLDSIISAGESDMVEFKEMVPSDSKKYVKTVVAFSNGSGGRIVFGVDDDYNILGINPDSVSRIKDQIADTITSLCAPTPRFDMQTVTLEDKIIIILEIFPGPDRPYYLKSEGYNKGVYVRLAGISKPADERTRKELQLEGRKESFDSQMNFNCTVETEDVERICRDLSEMSGREVTIQNLINEHVLIKKSRGYSPTNAYALLLGNVFINTTIRCAMFKGKEKNLDKTMFLDRRECEGPIYKQIEDAYAFVLKNIRLESYTTEGITRRDVYEMPPKAIREIITNAALHCSYQSTNPIYVALYEDRLEVISPGKLFGGLTIDSVMSGATARRNPILSRIFALADISEGWGRGIKGILEECQTYGLKEPVFEEWATNFRVTMYRKNVPNNDNVSSGTQLSSTESAVYDYFTMNPEKSRSDAAEALSLSLATIRNAIKSLKDKGLIAREGGTGKGRWIVK